MSRALLLLALACGRDDPDTGDPDTDTAEIEDEWGFSMRIPRIRDLDCPSGPRQELDSDWLCTFDHGGATGVVYVQNTPTGCVSVGESDSPLYTSPRSALAAGGAVEELSGGLYDWGGNHHNDALHVDRGGLTYRYDHSSFGFGWRVCQEFDCVQVWDGTTLVEDGCTCDRTLPTACSRVTAEGTWPPLVDDFAVCPGDDTCGT